MLSCEHMHMGLEAYINKIITITVNILLTTITNMAFINTTPYVIAPNLFLKTRTAHHE